MRYPPKVKPGDVWRINYGKLDSGESNPNNKVIHIRGIIDDEYVVWKTWDSRKQRWQYEIEWNYLLHILEQDGFLEPVKEEGK